MPTVHFIVLFAFEYIQIFLTTKFCKQKNDEFNSTLFICRLGTCCRKVLAIDGYS